MKKPDAVTATLLFSLLALLLLGSLALAQSDSQPDQPAADYPAHTSDSNPTGPAQVSIPARYRPSSTAAANATTAVYFTPQDENTSTTILFLYNTGQSAATVGLESFTKEGTVHISTAVGIPAGALVRIAGDNVVTTSSSWQDAVVVNFTTFSAYAKMTLPAAVKAEGYVVWNDGDNYDPLQPAPTLPLRFSTDPLNIFLPSLPAE